MFTFGVRAHDYGRDTADKLLGRIAGDGWTHTQLAYQKAVEGINDFDDITPEVLELTKQALRKHKIGVCVFGCYIEPSIVDENIRRKEAETFIKCIPYAKELSSGCIGTETTNMEKQPQVKREQALNALRRSLTEILPVAEANGVIVGIEPVFYHAMATPEITKTILNEMCSENLKVIFDPVNLLAPETVADQRNLWNRSMEAFGEDIVAVHIKGAQVKDNKLVSAAYEDSVVDYQYIFSLLKQLKQDLTVLREEVKPENAKADLEFLKRLSL